MMRTQTLYLAPFLLFSMSACSDGGDDLPQADDEAAPGTETGGASGEEEPATGGQTASGGTASGGAATGGEASTGGNPAAGGDVGTGGDDGTGGDVGTGGGDGAGGDVGAGGDMGAGGTVSTGGQTGAGGSDNTGGDNGTGGDMGTGGSVEPGALPSGTYLMDDDGYVMFEFEDLAGDDPPGDWIRVEDDTASGGAYYEHITDAVDNCGNHSSGGNGTLTLQFEAKESGFYRMVWANMKDTRTAGCENDRNNDSFVKFPGALNGSHFADWFKVYGGSPSEFDWGGNYDISGVDPERGQVCVQLEAGAQTMEISARSNYHAIDRVAIVYGDESGCSGSTSNLDDRDNTGQAP